MRKHADQPEPAPVSIRTIVLNIHPDGSMTVTVDGASLPPEDEGRPWTRAGFPQIIDQASDERTVPVRIEVHEADGTSFTDLLPARPRRTPPPDPAPEPAVTPRTPRSGARLIEITGEGFVAGEDVACALIAGHTDAAPDGRARALVEAKQLQEGVGEVVLVGRVSGHVVFQSLP